MDILLDPTPLLELVWPTKYEIFVLKQPAHSIAEKIYERETVTKSKYKTKNEVPVHGKFLASPGLQGQLANFVVPANKQKTPH